MRKYLDLLEHIYSKEHSAFSKKMVFGALIRINLQEGFPLSTTRNMKTEHIVEQTLDFLYTQSSPVQHHLEKIIKTLQEWIVQVPVAAIPSQSLTWSIPTPTVDRQHPFLRPHTIQFFVQYGRLNCFVHELETDVYNQLPLALVSYSMFVHMLAQQLDLQVGELLWTGGECFIQQEDFALIKQQLMKTPRPLCTFAICTHPKTIWDYKLSDFEYIGYRDCE